MKNKYFSIIFFFFLIFIDWRVTETNCIKYETLHWTFVIKLDGKSMWLKHFKFLFKANLFFACSQDHTENHRCQPALHSGLIIHVYSLKQAGNIPSDPEHNLFQPLPPVGAAELCASNNQAKEQFIVTGRQYDDQLNQPQCQ